MKKKRATGIESKFEELGDQFFGAQGSKKKFTKMETDIREKLREMTAEHGSPRPDGGSHFESAHYEFDLEIRSSEYVDTEYADEFFTEERPELLKKVTTLVFDKSKIEQLWADGEITDEEHVRLIKKKPTTYMCPRKKK